MFKFAVGDHVHHDNFGSGFVAAIRPQAEKTGHHYLIKFESGQRIYCRDKLLTKKEKSNKMEIAVIKFRSSCKLYDFKTDIQLDINDTVVVDTDNGFGVGEVAGFKKESTMATKWVLSKVDIRAHEARLAREKKVKELKKEMDKRRKAVEEATIHAYLTQVDAEYSRIHSQLAALGEV